MSDQNVRSRRDLLRTVAYAGAAGLLAPIMIGCGKKELTCDASGISAEDALLRKNLEYVDNAPDQAKNCTNCALYKPAAPEQCGGCSVLKGPIHPKGFCKSWAAKPA